ncbi:NUDIX hydrolase [Ectobacillus ponti]|uniref:8-oxo-dGTP diphosphatase n=1 Tax=Ectobacillus ponti TaxID=2961894 RepID=A0AA41X694_9BACI|nr:8-oxo-dGTP diphosphatase [Ectobacillus ponti]MCP8967110.1 8-oxo-dGTP diphosphatase [Ectobacillus ponti]
MHKYTICFIQRGNDVLLLNRSYSPNMGLWNGVGGKLDAGETPEQGILREVMEETGILLSAVSYRGTVTWKSDHEDWGGMYMYTAQMPDIPYVTPQGAEEGILDWKPIAWVLDPENDGVVSNIRHFLPHALAGRVMEHTCHYDGNQLVSVASIALQHTGAE